MQDPIQNSKLINPGQPESQPAQNLEDKSQQNVQIETEGFGRFEYANGTIYEGQWKIVGNNQKVKHGEGTLVHAGSTAHEKGNEEYRGSWVEDKMEGYGIYFYTSGAIYKGDWKDNKHHGKGTYEFPDGCLYDGEWKNHRMHGEGCFIDREGNRWDGLEKIILCLKF